MGIPHSASVSPLSPLGEACSRRDLTAIHEILEKISYKDDEGVANEVHSMFSIIKNYCMALKYLLSIIYILLLTCIFNWTYMQFQLCSCCMFCSLQYFFLYSVQLFIWPLVLCFSYANHLFFGWCIFFHTIFQLSFQMWTDQMQETLNSKKKGDVAFRQKDLKDAIECYTQVKIFQWNAWKFLITSVTWTHGHMIFTFNHSVFAFLVKWQTVCYSKSVMAISLNRNTYSITSTHKSSSICSLPDSNKFSFVVQKTIANLFYIVSIWMLKWQSFLYLGSC